MFELFNVKLCVSVILSGECPTDIAAAISAEFGLATDEAFKLVRKLKPDHPIAIPVKVTEQQIEQFYRAARVPENILLVLRTPYKPDNPFDIAQDAMRQALKLASKVIGDNVLDAYVDRLIEPLRTIEEAVTNFDKEVEEFNQKHQQQEEEDD